VSPLFVIFMFALGVINGWLWAKKLDELGNWLLRKFGFLVIRCFAAPSDLHSYLHDALDSEKPCQPGKILHALWGYTTGLLKPRMERVSWVGFWWLKKRR